MRKYTVIIIGIIIILSAISITYIYLDSMPHASYRVVFTKTGFSPQYIMVTKGDIVVFTTTRAKSFWPASDLHPTHEIYPEFDPKKPIAAGQSWSFQFNRVGTWNYHDHLDSYFRGTIKVEGTDMALSEVADAARAETSCSTDEDASKRAQCWQGIISHQLRKNNLDAAFAALDKFIKQDTSALGGCHGLAHQIGEQAFKLFNQRKDFALSPKTSYCGYGFYHGFMETLVHTTNDMAQARAFCDYADTKLKFFIADAGGACLHGIGHGSVDDTPNPSVWGNMQKIIEPALALCERVSADGSQLFRCTSGAFNALEIISDAGKYKLSPNQKDPFSICREQPEKYKRACYTQFLVAAMFVSHDDFPRTARFIDTIQEDAYAKETLAGLAVERARLQNIDYDKTVLWCRTLTNRFRIPCITGFAEGFLKYGPPESEYIKAIDFCASTLLSEKEQIPCFDRVLAILRNFYTVAKSREICLSVEKQYRLHNCEYN